MVNSNCKANKIYFSGRITEDPYHADWENIKAILDEYLVNFGFLDNTLDIWCRDYMPIQLQDKSFIQLRYEPSYLEKYPERKSDPKIVNTSNGFVVKDSEINLDGGNIIQLSDKTIVTDRIFEENKDRFEREELPELLGAVLGTKILVIPSIKTDLTGHADGMVRAYDERTIIVNEFEHEYIYIRKGIEKIQTEHNLEIIEIPWFEFKEKKYPDSAIGCYINFLKIGNLVLLPKFEVSGNRDAECLELFQRIFPDHIVKQVNINRIARDGGLLNCISWDVYEPELRVIARLGNTLYICFAEHTSNGAIDRLVIQADLEKKEMINPAWSFQKHLKYNGAYMDSVDEDESRKLLFEICNSWHTIEYRKIIDELIRPGAEGLDSLVF